MRWLVLFAALSVAACDAPLVPDGASPSAVRSSPNAGPGTKPADPTQAGSLFKSVCVDTLPNFKTASTKIMAPFVQNSGTKTYYHPVLNLSLKLPEGRPEPVCSIVFQSNLGKSQVTQKFYGAVGGTPALLVPFPDGYYGAKLTVK